MYHLRVRWKLRFLVLFNVAFAVFLIFKPVGPFALRAVDDLAQAIGPGLTLTWFIAGAGIREPWRNLASRTPRARGSRPFGFAIWIWLSVVCYVVAQSVYSYLELTSGKTPQSSLCDVLYFSISFAVLAGIVTLPTRPTPAAMRTRIVLDGLTIMAGAVTFSWYFLVGPMLLNATAPLLTRIVGAAYPLQQLLLVFCFIRLTARMGETLLQPALNLLRASILIDIAAQSIYGYQLLHNAYVTGSLLDVMWSTGIMLLGLSAYAGRLAAAEANESGAALAGPEAGAPEPSPSAIRGLLPYATVPIVVVFAAIIGSIERDTPLKVGVYVGAGTLVALTLLRQSFAFLENAFLYNRLHEAYDSLAENNRRAIEHAESMRKINAELKSVQNELVHSAKLASLGTLATGIAHELNQPLAVIRGMVQQLLGEPSITDDQREDLTLIEGQTTRMKKIILHLRTFARAGNDERKRVDVNHVVRDCFILVGTQLKANGVRVVTDLSPDEPAVLGDANELEQVLLNLLTNARDAMEGLPDPCIAISTQIAGDACRIVCRDNGPGIPEEIAAQVFDPFFTTKDPGKGTGLGLSISHSIIRKHHGTITVENSGGAVFTITLPLTETQTPSGSSDGRAATLDLSGEGAASVDRAA